MKATLTQCSPNFCFDLLDETGKSIQFVQSDWDYPGLASMLGWDIQQVSKEVEDDAGNAITIGGGCLHDSTDGTVECKNCKLKAGDFIASAYDWLVEHDGEEFDIDGDYFE